MQLTCIAKYLPQHVTSISETLQFNLRSDTRVYLDSRCILCHAVYRQTETFTSASVLKTKKNIFLDILIQEIFFYIMRIVIFRGDLADISAKKKH